MALRGALTHRKTRRLARLLGLPLPCALGVMEALWHVTANHAPTGAIGRLSNQDVADEMFWDGDADELMGHLVAAELVDMDAEFRLVVHGWDEHADQAVKRRVARSGEAMVSQNTPRLAMASHEETPANHGETHARLKPVPEPEPVPVPEPEPGTLTSSGGERQKNGAAPAARDNGKDYTTKKSLDIGVDHVSKRWSDRWREVRPNARSPAIQSTDRNAVREALKGISAADGCDYLAAEQELTNYAERLAELGKPLQRLRWDLNDLRNGTAPGRMNGAAVKETPQEQRDRILRELADADQARRD